MRGKSKKELLKSIKNPYVGREYRIKSVSPEVTFIGHKGETIQPDFAEVSIEMIPFDKVIELKSLKIYMQHFRDQMMSYERLINTIYDDMLVVYKPIYLKVTMKTNPRGGIYSELTMELK